MKTLTFISAWVCALLLSANASAQSVTYNFVVADEGTIQLPTWGAEVTSGGVALYVGSATHDVAVGSDAVGNDETAFGLHVAGAVNDSRMEMFFLIWCKGGKPSHVP